MANKWMRANYGEALRTWLKKQNIKEIIDFGDLPVFEGATAYPLIITIGNNKPDKQLKVCNVKTLKFDNLESYVADNSLLIDQSSLDNKGWNLVSNAEKNLLQKITKHGIPLGDYVKGKIYYGIKTGLNEAFVIDEATKNTLIKEHKSSADIIKPFLLGRDIKRYQKPASDNHIILFPKGFTNGQGKNPKNGWKWLKENYPALTNHLEPFKEKGEKRYDKGEYWWELRACDYYEEFEKPKLIFPDIAVKMQATFDSSFFYCVNTAYIIPLDDKFLLALMNSNLIHHYSQSISPSIRGGYLRFIRQYIETIPIRTNKLIQKSIVTLVDQLLQLNIDKANTKLDSKLSQLQNKIDYCEDKINQLVYQLYELTEEEIQLIEGK